MRLAALVDSDRHVCCRYRLRAFVPGLAQAGITLNTIPLPRGLGRWNIPSLVSDADAVILQRKLLARWELARLRKHVKRLIFDFDDAVFMRDSYHRKGADSPRSLDRFQTTVQAADAVVAGNEWLAEQARKAGAQHTVVIPTCVDPATYPLAPHVPKDRLTIAWIGSASTMKGLEIARPLLEELGKALPQLTLRLVCDKSITFDHLAVHHVTWTEARETAALATSDAGISILPDDDWSRGKCGLKVLQYMAAGLPVVGNPVGITPKLLGESSLTERAGILVNSTQDWIEALTQLQDPTLRQVLGSIGRRRVETQYSVECGLQLWFGLLQDRIALRLAG
jgi:glycosyltransferase involved in cell wall biosynthesis